MLNLFRTKLLSRPLNMIQTVRRLGTGNLKSAVAGEFGQAADDSFLPDRELLELDHEAKQESTISLKGTDVLRHKEEFEGTIYKYDLPVGNVPIVFKRQAALALLEQEVELTPV